MVAVSVLVADSQRLFADSLATTLGVLPDVHVLPERPLTAFETLTVARRLRPDVVLLDYGIDGEGSGPDAAWEVRADLPGTKVLMVSWIVGRAQVDASLAAGASGFLPRSLGVDQVVEAVRRAHRGESPVYAAQLRRLVEAVDARHDEVERRSHRLSSLSPRELEVLDLLRRGHSSQKLAAELFVSDGTLRNHIHSILKKTGAKTQQEAVQMVREGVIQLPGHGPPVGTWTPPKQRSGGISVVVADEQRLMAEALGQALAQREDLHVVRVHFGSGSAALQEVVRAAPDLVLYDFWMPETTGPALTRYLGTWAPRTRVLLMSWFHGPVQVHAAMEAGAAAMIRKGVSLQSLIGGILDAHHGRVVSLSEPLPTRLRLPQTQHSPEHCWERLRTLTPREIQVLHLLCEGWTRHNVAETLGITQSTARNHMNSILKKTGAETRLEAIELARHEGLIRERGAPAIS